MDTSTNGARPAVELAAAGPEDQGGVAELGFGAGGGAAPEVPGRGEVPDPELVEQAKRRSFTAEYKARILARPTRAPSRARSASCCVVRGCTRRI